VGRNEAGKIVTAGLQNRAYEISAVKFSLNTLSLDRR
jgi:hypothetical protein